MLHYDCLMIEFYTAPLAIKKGGTGMLTPEESLVQRLAASPATSPAWPRKAYAFRIVPAFFEVPRTGGVPQHLTYDSAPLCFLGGTVVKQAEAEFIRTKDDLLVPFDPLQDVLLEKQGKVWEQVYPALQPA